MKVYIVTTSPFPNGFAATNRIRCYAKGISHNGIPCEVLVVKRTENGPSRNLNREGRIESYSFRYVSKHTNRSVCPVVRKVYDYVDEWLSYRYLTAQLKKGDVVIYYGSWVLYEKMILRISHKVGAKVVRELCEFPFSELENAVYDDKKYKNFVNNILPLYDFYFVISHAMEEFVMSFTSNDNILRIPIMLDKLRLSSPSTSSFDVHKPFIYHNGTITERKDCLIETLTGYALALSKLNFPLYYYIAGDFNNSPIKEELNIIIEKYSLHNLVVFLGVKSYEDSLKILKKADLVILNKQENIQNHFGFSTKLSEYLYYAKPVITTYVGEAKFYLKDNESAFFVAEGSPELIAEKIVEVFSDTNKRISVGQQGKIIAEKEFDCIYQGSRINSFLNKNQI